MPEDLIYLPDAPCIPGLSFRHLRGESDYAPMAAALNASSDADHVERAMTTQDFANVYTHLVNSDAYQDVILAEVGSQVIGYARSWWVAEENDGPYVYPFVGFLMPAWRRRGIGGAVLRWLEQRLRTVAAGHPPERPKFFQAFANEAEVGLAAMLEKNGYRPARYFHDMVRPTLDDIPDFPLPPGIEVRPVQPSHYRPIWDAGVDAFRDHWNATSPGEADYEAWLHDSVFQPHLWIVAWDVAANRVAGQVRTYIDQHENEKFGRRRGQTEFISVIRPWRRRGLARALIARSLQVQKDQGMTESALGVDSENLCGATRVYEDCGFRVVRRNMIYRKPL